MLQQTNDFFSQPLAQSDQEVHQALLAEWQRQNDCIELIASENIASLAVLQAVGSVNNNKYAEGYPGRRYYGGCRHIDQIERLAIERACKLFGCSYANVQPHSGSQANQAVFMSLMQPGDTFLGMDLSQGGHLTHGAKPNMSGKWFNPEFYGINSKTGLIDFDALARKAQACKPKLIIAGASAYPRIIDFAKFRSVADSVGAYLMTDIAHIAGLVAAGLHPSPFPAADVVTTTTHKTLRCARGGLILTNNEDLAKKINSSIFPGLQGGPLEQQIAGKAVGLGEALRPEYRQYCQAVIENASYLAEQLLAGGLGVLSGGTDNHLVLIDLTNFNLTGKAVERALESIGIICNKNAVPNDPEKPWITSGIRLGSAAMTTRGFGKDEFAATARLILEVITTLHQHGELTEAVQESFRQRVKQLTSAFPAYPKMPPA